MTNKPIVHIEYSAYFKKELKRLRKKYRSIQSDVQALIDRLERGETPGDQMQGISRTIFKVRVRNTDIGKGKRGGYPCYLLLKNG